MFETYSINFLSVVLEALPFVFLGTLISSTIEAFMPQDWIADKLGEGKWTHYIAAGLLGLLIPVCECAIVPIGRRLIRKGAPVGLAITFMMAAPIVNPIVLFSTYYAFSGNWSYVIGRGVLGFVGAMAIGGIMSIVSRRNEVLLASEASETTTCGCGESHVSHQISMPFTIVEVEPAFNQQAIFWHKAKHAAEHLSGEFIEVSRFLIIGAMIAAAMQTFVPRAFMMELSGNSLLSIVLMMALAFVLSLCSEADAFIAATFRSALSQNAVMGFLIFGPMIDIKNTLMLLAGFKKPFVMRLILVIFMVCLFLSSLFGAVI